MPDRNSNLFSAVACQEAVKKGNIMPEGNLTPLMLKTLRQALSMSLSEFGLTLRRSIDPHATTGYTRQYISRLEHGQDTITPELAAAYWDIAGVLDDMPAGAGGAVIVQFMAQPGQVPDGVVPMLTRGVKIVRCARPGCPVWFPKHGSQKYHDIECREQDYKQRRRRQTS
jgi:transcriptional regulator with XRE-family HTH domain